jgi:hypothetical protein
MAEAAPSCAVCGRGTYDPDKRERPWARGVRGGRLVLICPRCQAADPGWVSGLDRCVACSSTRLTLTLGQVVCRECGEVAPVG